MRQRIISMRKNTADEGGVKLATGGFTIEDDGSSNTAMGNE